MRISDWSSDVCSSDLAAIVNDVTALEGDPESLAVAAEIGAPVILMHMQGEPQTMQANTTYESAALDIYRYLAGRVEACVAAGIAPARVVVDPGIGFGRTPAHNLPPLDRSAERRGGKEGARTGNYRGA